jgi:hypothetical protein
VYHSRGVDGAEASRQPGRQRQHRIDGQRSVAAHRLGQRWSSDISSGQPRHRAVQIRVDHERREHAAYLPGRGDFLPELRPELGICGQFGPDDLDRDRLPVRRLSQEYLPHPAVAQLAKQAVWPDSTRVIRL